jgi:CheY-like chemotaxis protein
MLVAAEVARQEAIKSILVIDDEPRMAKLIRRVLAAARFAVGIATSGLTGLGHARSDALDLVILDLLLQTSTGSPSSRITKDLDRGPPASCCPCYRTCGPGRCARSSACATA